MIHMPQSRRPRAYRRTVTACYFAYLTQAAVVCLPPLLFIPLREQYGLSFTLLGSLVFVNFITQVICDLLFSNMLDKYGYRPFTLAASLLTVAGFAFYALTPILLPNQIYAGLFFSTVIFAGAGGLLEITLSPIIDSIPCQSKGAAMSLLHSFYAWGQVGVVLVTTLLLALLGSGAWRFIVVLWLVLPVTAFLLFLGAPLAPPAGGEQRRHLRDLIVQPFFLVAMLTIALGSATELCVSQWSSSFMEKGIGLPKLAGDIFGMAFFALMMGAGRLFYGIFGAKLNLSRIMSACCLLGVLCYLALALSTSSVVAVLACGMTGLASSLLWPGTLVLTGEKYPSAGAWMFAVLSCAGDIGGSAGPWLMGVIADNAPKIPFVAELCAGSALTAEQLGLRVSILFGALFPLAAFACILWMKKDQRKNRRKIDSFSP